MLARQYEQLWLALEEEGREHAVDRARSTGERLEQPAESRTIDQEPDVGELAAVIEAYGPGEEQSQRDLRYRLAVTRTILKRYGGPPLPIRQNGEC